MALPASRQPQLQDSGHHLFPLALWPTGGGGFLLLPPHSLFRVLGLPSLVQPIPSMNVPLFLIGPYLISRATYTADRNLSSAHEVFSFKGSTHETAARWDLPPFENWPAFFNVLTLNQLS